MSFGENKGLWISLGAVVLALIAILWILLSASPPTLVILLPETGDLKKDDPVLWHEFVVGKVTRIEPLVNNQFGVTIRLNEDYTSRITQGTTFTLRRRTLLGLVGRNAIDIEIPASPGRPYQKGETVQGVSPPAKTLVDQGKQLTIEYWRQLTGQATALIEEYKQSPYKKQVDDALQQLKALAEEGARQAADKLDEFRKNHQQEIDRVVEKLEQARDWMKKKGDAPGAERLQKEIDGLKKK